MVWSLGRKDPLEKVMAPHSSTLAWKIPWMEEPGRLQSMGLKRVTRLHFSLVSHREHLEQRQIYHEVKLQGLSLAQPPPDLKSPSNVFIWSNVFIKFAKVRYFNYSQLRLLSLFTLTSISHFPVYWVILEWWSKHFGNSAKGKLNNGLCLSKIYLCALQSLSCMVEFLLVFPV